MASDILGAVSRQDSLFAPEQRQSYQEQKRRAQAPKRIETIEKPRLNRQRLVVKTSTRLRKELASCVAYAIGSDNKWDFELGFLNNTACDVRTFDCTGSVRRFPP